MDTRLNIVVVEDNDDLREAIVDALRAEGHQVVGIECAEALPEHAAWRSIDLMVIDLNLPGEDGLALTQRVRKVQPGIGIILVTARHLPTDKLQGYAHGADIYITKPASLDELNAAIHALSRRLRPSASTPVSTWQLDPRQQRLSAPGIDIPLSSPESTLLNALCRSADLRLETWQLIDILDKGNAEDPKAALEIVITRLRKKLEQAGCTQLHIRAIRNWGYQLQGPVQLS